MLQGESESDETREVAEKLITDCFVLLEKYYVFLRLEIKFEEKKYEVLIL